MRSDEAGVRAEVDEGRCRPQDTYRLCEQRAEVLDVGVRERRERGVEPAVGERKANGVVMDELRPAVPARPGDAKLVGRDVDAGDRPAELEQQRDMKPVPQPRSRHRPGPAPTSCPTMSVKAALGRRCWSYQSATPS